MVVTDSAIIFDEIIRHGGKAIMSKKEHESGSDRIAEAVMSIEADVILNVQGDEPFVDAASLKQLIDVFSSPDVKVASVMKPFTDISLVENPNYVKVVVDQNMNSLLFSRSVIPYHREKNITPVYYEHIGVYAFRKETLLQFTRWDMTPLETLEKIECLRYLENGVPLKMVVTHHSGVKIDVPEDLPRAEAYLQSLGR
jgi:3-deoxy-manno-octulosonate cytidylyltransferase (CMP-KDO synthetase)